MLRLGGEMKPHIQRCADGLFVCNLTNEQIGAFYAPLIRMAYSRWRRLLVEVRFWDEAYGDILPDGAIFIHAVGR